MIMIMIFPAHDNHQPDQNHLFLKDLNLNLGRGEVPVEVEAALTDRHTLGTPTRQVGQVR